MKVKLYLTEAEASILFIVSGMFARSMETVFYTLNDIHSPALQKVWDTMMMDSSRGLDVAPDELFVLIENTYAQLEEEFSNE